MIPIKYRLDSAAEKEYIVKALSSINDAKDYSDKLETFLTDMEQKGFAVAGKILNEAQRFKTDYPDSWCLCGWLVMSYEEMAEIKEYLHDMIHLDLEPINEVIRDTGGEIQQIKSYHDLQSRKAKSYTVHAYIHGIMLNPVNYDAIYNDFKKFNEFYDNWSKKKINYWITKKTELKVCPYCNISYTYSRGKAVTAQLDHFFPKSEYPILALCFYNLVPSCPSCNKLKLDNTEKMASPYKVGCFKDLRFTWDYREGADQDKYCEKGSLNTLEEMIDIKIETSKEDEQHNLNSMKIEEAYQQHRDYASEIIKKVMTYTNQETQKLICNIGASIGITSEEIERFYLGNYLDENDLKKRPLSKMTKDFYDEIVCAKNRLLS